MKKLSIVIPIYNELESLPELLDELASVLKGNYDYEIVCVDDGSSDGSAQFIRDQATQNEHVISLRLLKNAGKSAALRAGFKRASGDYIVTLDGDLQDDPGEIPNLVAKLEEGYDLVSGWKKKRLDPLSKRWPSKLFNIVTRLLTGIKIHDFNCGLKIYRKELVKSIDVYGGRHRYIPVLAGQRKFKVGEIVVNHRPRQYGKTKYGGFRFFHGFFDLLSVLFLDRFDQRPLHLFGLFGVGSTLVSFVIEGYVIYLKVFAGHSFQKHFALILFGAMLFFLGLWFFSVGLIAEMIARAQQTREERDYQVIED
ncbi:MAG: glycosyltransferase family 2 protein [Fidelibacterota bacterium]